MSEDYLAQQQPTLTWNSVRGVWEKAGMANLLCEHWELFSETWQTSGWMRNGQVFELPMLAHHITDSESLLLRSPTASQGEGGALGEDEARKRGNTVGIRDQAMDLAALNGEQVSRAVRNLMPTVTAQAAKHGSTPDRFSNTPMGANLWDLPHVLPTPTTQDGKNNAGPSQFKRNSNPLNVEAVLIPTAAKTNWGKFEAAIRRWEETLGRPAPLPTKADGKDNAHRLSSAFTEWMMGVPEGWITDCGLTRNEELKACGNGVVPQQAELALRTLLQGVNIDLRA